MIEHIREIIEGIKNLIVIMVAFGVFMAVFVFTLIILLKLAGALTIICH